MFSFSRFYKTFWIIPKVIWNEVGSNDTQNEYRQIQNSNVNTFFLISKSERNQFKT